MEADGFGASCRPVTRNDRYFVIRGRLSRISHPRVCDDERKGLVADPMDAWPTCRLSDMSESRSDLVGLVGAHGSVENTLAVP